MRFPYSSAALLLFGYFLGNKVRYRESRNFQCFLFFSFNVSIQFTDPLFLNLSLSLLICSHARSSAHHLKGLPAYLYLWKILILPSEVTFLSNNFRYISSSCCNTSSSSAILCLQASIFACLCLSRAFVPKESGLIFSGYRSCKYSYPVGTVFCNRNHTFVIICNTSKNSRQPLIGENVIDFFVQFQYV